MRISLHSGQCLTLLRTQQGVWTVTWSLSIVSRTSRLYVMHMLNATLGQQHACTDLRITGSEVISHAQAWTLTPTGKWATLQTAKLLAWSSCHDSFQNLLKIWFSVIWFNVLQQTFSCSPILPATSLSCLPSNNVPCTVSEDHLNADRQATSSCELSVRLSEATSDDCVTLLLLL